jgi:hypothetical protein
MGFIGEEMSQLLTHRIDRIVHHGNRPVVDHNVGNALRQAIRQELHTLGVTVAGSRPA